MSDSLVKRELKEIEQFVNNFNFSTVVFRKDRKIEVISDLPESVDENMRDRFDTEKAATVAIIGEGDITELYDVPSKYDHFDIIVFEIRKTRSERGLDPVVAEDSNGLRELNTKEVQDIDQQLRDSNMDLDGLTKELYEDLQDLQIPDMK